MISKVTNNPVNNNIYSVSSLNQSVANLLEQQYGWIWVEGEMSNLAQPASGHIYFSLKDHSAQEPGPGTTAYSTYWKFKAIF